MTIDQNHAANFVGIAVSALKTELSATTQRAERLNHAVAHAETARSAALEALATAQALRAARLERLVDPKPRAEGDA
jgi:hypothetical protein